MIDFPALPLPIEERIESMVRLGEELRKLDTSDDEFVINEAMSLNSWFSRASIHTALEGITNHYLDRGKLAQWILKYQIKEGGKPKKVGLILAGNIPMVGFHDLLCVYLSGNVSLVKLSDKDSVLMKHVIDVLKSIHPANELYFSTIEKLKDFDAVIATGSNNSSRYFESYFSSYPHIIRKNRNAVAVIHGDESEADFKELGKDIFTYFGLGCRNVSKLFVPESYDFTMMLDVLHAYNEVIHHHKYKNNFDYNIALFMLNKAKYLNNGAFMVVEDRNIASRIATVNYEHYQNKEQLRLELNARSYEIQCIVSNKAIEGFTTFLPGQAQNPNLGDYADGVDTMDFLLKL